jgi:solute carrier family 25 carnitine/acylcarnitine transporter 20/29
MLDAFASIFRAGGVRGLYKGVSAPLLGVTPIFAVCFWGYEVGLQLFDSVTTSTTKNPENKDITRIMVAGGFSALPTTLIMAPAERIKVIMQTSEAGFSAAITRAWHEGGIRSVFKGSMATLARDIPGSVAYFAVYEVAKRRLRSSGGGEIGAAGILAAGGLAGMANWAVAIPADVVKSRWQSAPKGTYSSTVDVFTRLIREEGPRSLFRGFVPVMARAFPANAACFFGMETSREALHKLFP